jgi:Zn-dependent M28 family amino/carboxypeptidase
LKRPPRLLAAALALTALSSVRAADEQPVPVIDPRALAAHMRFLSDDLLQGRATGSEGYAIAARYVAAQFEAAGLEPAGTQGFLQPVALRSAELDERRSFLRLSIPGASTTTLRHLDQVLILPSFARTQDDLQGPVVFVGYGITAPDLRHDDYAGADVAGKVVAVLQGAPTGFPDVLRAHHSSPQQKAENAAAHGAIGLLSLASPQEQVPWRLYVRWARMPALRWVYGDEVEDALPALHGAAVLGTNVADRILGGAGRTPAEVYARAAAGEHQAFATGTRVALRTVTRHRVVESPNVAAVLRGTDPALRAQTVVFSAHLDHLGLGEPLDGDRIYNGAVDNASGVAAVIEIARAMAATAGPPRRSVLFLAVTGEEAGLLGSDYFAHHPTVPAGSIVADINIDSLGLLLPSADVAGIGADSSTLGETLQRAAQRLGIEISPDPVPAQVLFIRSDQYSFVRQGVPSVFLNSGFKPLHAGDDPAQQFERWLGTVYHSPKDDMAQQPLDLLAGARLARLNLLLGLLVADQPERPQWKPGDFFGRTYGAQRKAS